MEFMALGGAQEIGANSFYYHLNGTGILIDSGMNPHFDGAEALPPIEMLRDHALDAFILTHAHHDHIGSVPVTLTQYPHMRLHMTIPTRDLFEVMLNSSVKVQTRQKVEKNLPYLPLFDRPTVEALAQLAEQHRYDAPFEIEGRNGEAVRVTMHDAGHILGSAGVMMEVGGKRIFHSGDVSWPNQTLIKGLDFPEGPVDVLVLECTQGANKHAESVTRRGEILRLGKAITEVIDRNGTVLIPCFALGRSQEILTTIYSLMKGQYIPEVPIYSGGMMRAIADVYDKHALSTRRTHTGFKVADIPQSRLPDRNYDRAKFYNEPSIVVASSGMLTEHTPANQIAQRIIGEPKNGVFFVGYVDSETPGYRLLHSGIGEQVELDPKRPAVPRWCTINKFHFSSHSNRRELLQVVDRLKPKKVILVHGDPPANAWMAEQIPQLFPGTEVIIPEQGQVYDL